MSRKETVLAATVAIDHIDQDAYLRVVGGPPAGYERLDEGVVDGAGKEHAGCRAGHHKQYLTHVLVVLEHKVEQRHI